VQTNQAAYAATVASFLEADSGDILTALRAFVPDPGDSQVRAWQAEVKTLRSTLAGVVAGCDAASTWGIVLEYLVPMEARRIDAVLIAPGAVLALEFKGRSYSRNADIDQAVAYARDLNSYHRSCENERARAILVLTGARDYLSDRTIYDEVSVDRLAELVVQRVEDRAELPVSEIESFLDESAYQPLPTLVAAARRLFSHDPLPNIKRAHGATGPAISAASAAAHDAASRKKRALVLIGGVPGAGKTLVGLQLAHAAFLDDLAIDRAGGRPSSPAVFLSGNAPLVGVLQYSLRDAGGEGKAFVRGVKDYVSRYSKPGIIPPEHVLIYDEAQRAWDAVRVADKHQGANAPVGKSEPDLFIEFAERIPGWSCVVGLIGSGQEIHAGEEGGVVQWADAVRSASDADWVIHTPPQFADVFAGGGAEVVVDTSFYLTTELRFQGADRLHDWVRHVLDDDGVEDARAISRQLRGHHEIYVSRDLERAKEYVRDRYRDAPEHRYGLLASSRDKILPHFGIYNQFQDTKRFREGPWYAAEPRDLGSCCQLDATATEFQCQGLELDFAIIGWGTDFRREGRCWSSANARGYRDPVRDPHELRRNSYRVLLTRGRDGSVLFVPPHADLDATYDHLRACGARALADTAEQHSAA
jgi:hypothetical protein